MVIIRMRVTIVVICGDQVNRSSLLCILCLVVVMIVVVVMIDRCMVVVVAAGCVFAAANTPR